MQSHLWLTPYPGPIPYLKLALKKGKPRRGMPSSLFLKMSPSLLLPDPVLNQCLQLDDSETSMGLMSFKSWQGKLQSVSHGTRGISCASNVSQPKPRVLGFHSSTSTSLSSCNYTQLGSPSPCIRYSKNKLKVTQESTDTKDQVNATSDLL